MAIATTSAINHHQSTRNSGTAPNSMSSKSTLSNRGFSPVPMNLLAAHGHSIEAANTLAETNHDSEPST